MNRQRRAHIKSREGCKQCKERHVKCNEAHPQCLNCRRQCIPCSFSAPSLTTTPLSQDNLADLELLDYWHRRPVAANTTTTTTTTVSGPAAASRLEHDPVRLGFSHHYLLNSILALAALHRFDEDRSQTRWYVRAVAHRQAAITRAMPHLQNLEETEHLALLSFSFYVSLYALAEPVLRPALLLPGCPRACLDPVGELLQVIRLGRSSTAFVRQHLTSAVSSGSGSDPHLIAKYHPRRLEGFQGLESKFPQLAWLRAFIKRQCSVGEEAVAASLLYAAETLFVGIDRLVSSPDDPTQVQAIWRWANNVDNIFLDMCSAHDTAALVILAHFAVLLNLGKGNWCLRDWPAVLLGQIRDLLEEGFKDTTRWPEEVVFGNQPIISLAG